MKKYTTQEMDNLLSEEIKIERELKENLLVQIKLLKEKQSLLKQEKEKLKILDTIEKIEKLEIANAFWTNILSSENINNGERK